MIEYEYECSACGDVETVRHSIRVTPEVRCPCCDEPMSRAISGGREPLVKGGTVSGALDRRIGLKNAEDAAHAHNVAQKIKTEWQPRTQEAILKAPLKKA